MNKKKTLIIGSIFLIVGIIYLGIFLALNYSDNETEETKFNYISDEQVKNSTFNVNNTFTNNMDIGLFNAGFINIFVFGTIATIIIRVFATMRIRDY